MKMRVSNLVFVGACVCFAVIMSFCASGETNGSEVSGNEESFDELVRKFKVEKGRIRGLAVDRLLERRKQRVQKLIAVFDPETGEEKKWETRAAAAWVLGEMRAPEAAEVLAQNIDDGPDHTGDVSRYDTAHTTALRKIGLPAVPALIENIENSDSPVLRGRSVRILGSILGGKRRVLELLDRLEKRASEEKKKVRRIREARKNVRTWTEDEEPLY